MSTNNSTSDQAASASRDEYSGSFVQSIYQPASAADITRGSETENKKNLWLGLLDSVGVRRDIKQAHVILLGDRGAGKRSLIKAMNKPFLKQLSVLIQEKMDELGSDYATFDSSYLYVRDLGDENETAAVGQEETKSRINVWLITEPDMGQMLVKVLKPEDLRHTFAVIVPDMEQPWSIMQQCQKWMAVLKESIFKITPNLELRTLEFLKARIVDLYKTYEEPEFDKDGKFIPKKIQKPRGHDDGQGDDGDLDAADVNVELQDDLDMMDDIRNEMELPEGTVVTNLFIPCAVVCTKTDLIEHGDREIKSILERNLDYIQVTLRKFCLAYGASLIFTSANTNSNIKVLYDYLISRILDETFKHASNTADKEALFVPSGFDSQELIDSTTDFQQFLANVMKQMKDAGQAVEGDEPAYEDVIKKPQKGAIIAYEEKKQFLCQDWKSQLEAAFQDKEKRAQMYAKSGGKLRAAGNAGVFAAKAKAGATDAKAAGGLGQTAQPRAPNPVTAGEAAQAPTRSSVGGPAAAPQTTTAARASLDMAAGSDGGPQAPLSAKNTDAKKSAKVKDFYSSLLNKRKGEGTRAKPNAKPSDKPDTIQPEENAGEEQS